MSEQLGLSMNYANCRQVLDCARPLARSRKLQQGYGRNARFEIGEASHGPPGRSADAHIREAHLMADARADVGIRAPVTSFMATVQIRTDHGAFHGPCR